MIDRILKYLEQAGEPVAASRILRDVLNIRSPNEMAAGRVLKGIVGKDPRFRGVRGLWLSRSTHSRESSASLSQAALLFLEAGSRAGCMRGAVQATDGGAALEFQARAIMTRADLGALSEARSNLGNRLLLAWSPTEFRLWNRLLRGAGLEGWQGGSLCLRRLAASVLGRPERSLRLEDMASELELPTPDPNLPARMVQFLGSCFPLLLARVPEEHRRDLESLEAWIEASRPKADFSRFGFGPERLRDIPESPGVYLMRNRADDIVYVGKSRNLRRRVRSYFAPRALNDPKTARIHEQLHSIEVVETKSEVEALLMEMRLIRDFSPPINLQAEVHEQAGAYGKERNLLLLVPHEGQEIAEAYFLRDGCFVAQQPVRLGQAPSRRILQKLRSVFFTRRHIRKPAGKPWEVELVSRWLAANRKHLNYVDVDEAGGFGEASRRLACYLSDPGRLEEKVYYR